jgi:hypothetical protein
MLLLHLLLLLRARCEISFECLIDELLILLNFGLQLSRRVLRIGHDEEGEVGSAVIDARYSLS